MTAFIASKVQSSCGYHYRRLPHTLQSLTATIGHVRDPATFAQLRRLCETDQASPVTRDLSLRRIAVIMAAKGGTVGEITAGDCLELQLTVDHATLRSMAHVLGKLFWRDLERHHPGISSLRLAPEVAAGWNPGPRI